MTRAELMEWQAYIRLENEEMEEKTPDCKEKEEPLDVKQKRSQAVQRKLAAYLAKRDGR